ncbi:MAG: helix-turn-helix transcriptional regulator [Bacteroidetes bacterium]|nr:helix-turn-helix transcriptional regulator [Bacteroidota bacterium]
MIYLIDFSSFFLLPTEAKRLIFLKDIKDDAVMEFRQAIFFKGIFHYVFVNLYGVVLAIWQIFMISNLVKKGGRSFYTENRGMVLWFYVWAGLILFISLPDVIYGVFDYDVNLKRLTYVIPCLIAYPVFPISLFLSPALLYGTKGIWIEPLSAVQEDNLVFDEIKLESIKQNDDIKDVSPPVSGKKVYYKIEDAEILMNKIDQYMSSKKPYLNSEYAINDMAADLGFNVRQVSSLLNDYKGVSFKDYINGFRIEEFLRIHLNKKNSEKLTLEGLAINCGFANRFTFINAFKKIKGKTPSEYFDKDF